jgi:hypothetical protein
MRILEFGSGYFSTPLLHKIGKKLGHHIATFENNVDWVKEWTSDSQIPVEFDDQHTVEIVEDWQKLLQEIPRTYYDVIFIDQAPWEARHWTIEALRDYADFFVIHDSDMHPGYEIDYDDHFQYYTTYMPDKPYPYESGPPTLLGSNFRECNLAVNNGDFDQ